MIKYEHGKKIEQKVTLRLTTTEAFSVVMEAFDKHPTAHIPVIDEIGLFHNEAGSWSGYIHGKAEEAAKFDIPHFISGTLPNYMGEIPCILVLPNKEIPCTIIQWPGNNKPWKWRALIVANDDVEGRNYAVQCFNERKEDL